MKSIKNLVPFIMFIFFNIFLAISIAEGESFQLKSVKSVIEEDKIIEYTAQELIEKEKGKIFIINFLKSPFEKKYNMTTNKYKNIFKNADSLKRAFDKESYIKIDFIKIDLFNDNNPLKMTLKTNLHWFSEGYDGISTFYFILMKVKEEWCLDWFVY